jgi:hypothetical protein
LLGDADLFNGRVLVVSWKFEPRRVDGLLGDADLFSLCRTEAWRINGGLVDSDFFTIARLEARSVFTLGHVNLSLGVVMTTVMRNLDGDVSVVVSSVVWELDVDVCRGMFVVRSREKRSQMAGENNSRCVLLCQQTKKGKPRKLESERPLAR